MRWYRPHSRHRPNIGRKMSQGENNMQPDQGLNLGPLACRGSALQSELSGLFTFSLTNCDLELTRYTLPLMNNLCLNS